MPPRRRPTITIRVRRLRELDQAAEAAYDAAHHGAADALVMTLRSSRGRPEWPVLTSRSRSGWHWRIRAGRVVLLNEADYADEVNRGIVFGQAGYPSAIVQREWRLKSGIIERAAGRQAERAWNAGAVPRVYPGQSPQPFIPLWRQRQERQHRPPEMQPRPQQPPWWT